MYFKNALDTQLHIVFLFSHEINIEQWYIQHSQTGRETLISLLGLFFKGLENKSALILLNVICMI